MTALPLVDLAAGSAAERAADIDRALHETGFLLVANHSVPQAELDAARTAALAFFHQPSDVKLPVRITDEVQHGWVPSGSETNANAYGVADAPADLKEAFFSGRTGNRFPSGGFGEALATLAVSMERLGQDLLALTEQAIGVAPGTFTGSCGSGPFSMDANWYPAGEGVEVKEGQYRVGPHTDYGVLTLLDRQPGLGGLQIQTLDDEWIDAPYVPGTLTINTGDLMSHWSGGRWRSTRHRVLPPPAVAPREELLSLVYFHNADDDAVITPLGAAGGEPVVAGEYLATKMAALLNGPTTGTELAGVIG